MTPKIATCCYCGTRAALVLSGTVRHELACRSCGAALHDLKRLKVDHDGQKGLVRPSPVRAAPARAPRPAPAPRPKKRKRRKSFGRRMLEEAWDVLEDILD